MKRNGFTLVELLTVIIILSLVLAIAYPKVSSLIENEKQRTFKLSVNSLINGAKNVCANYQSELNASEKTYTYIYNKFKCDTEILEMSNSGKFISPSIIAYNKDCEISLSVENEEYKATKDYSDSDITIVRK